MTGTARDDWDDNRSLEKTRDDKGLQGMTRDDWDN